VCVQNDTLDGTVLQKETMGRPPKDRTGPATEALSLRLTPEDRALLNRLVTMRSEELSDEAVEVTATSYVRALIRREARAKGILDDNPGPVRADAGKVIEAPTRTKVGNPSEPTADELRAALVRAIEAGAVQADIGREAGIDGGDVSRFKAGKGTLSAVALRKLAAALTKAR
jgi:hypothetical protein